MQLGGAAGPSGGRPACLSQDTPSQQSHQVGSTAKPCAACKQRQIPSHTSIIWQAAAAPAVRQAAGSTCSKTSSACDVQMATVRSCANLPYASKKMLRGSGIGVRLLRAMWSRTQHVAAVHSPAAEQQDSTDWAESLLGSCPEESTCLRDLTPFDLQTSAAHHSSAQLSSDQIRSAEHALTQSRLALVGRCNTAGNISTRQ